MKYFHNEKLRVHKLNNMATAPTSINIMLKLKNCKIQSFDQILEHLMSASWKFCRKKIENWNRKFVRIHNFYYSCMWTFHIYAFSLSALTTKFSVLFVGAESWKNNFTTQMKIYFVLKKYKTSTRRECFEFPKCQTQHKIIHNSQNRTERKNKRNSTTFIRHISSRIESALKLSFM